jgi:endonuclease/exonuclease/phosphatase family metal-dependent hydrolase
MNRLRVVTMNVLAPAYAGWPGRRELLAGRLRALEPDIVALQEVVPDGTAEILGEGWHVVAHSGVDGGVGAALASRWPVRETHELDQRPPGREIRTDWCATVVAEVLAPPPWGPLWIVHHKPSWPYGYEAERELQALRAARFVEELLPDPATHVVLLGDLDATPDSASIRFLTGKQALNGTSVSYIDAWASVYPAESGHTFTPDNALVRAGDMPLETGRRIDYVLVRGGPWGPPLAVAGCRRVLVDPVDGVQASDHYGLMADLTPPPHPPGAWPAP